jgi:hypothetical protein
MPEKWKNSKYIKQRMIQIDKRGSVWERFFAEVLFKLFPRRIEYKDWDQWDWDLKISKLKFEIKTSSLDVNNKFQNEWLKENWDYDGILFLWIAPNQLYIRFIKMTDIDFKNLKVYTIDWKIMNLHNRWKDNMGKKATWAGYKCDFKEKEMIKVDNLEDIKNEFEKVFGKSMK